MTPEPSRSSRFFLPSWKPCACFMAVMLSGASPSLGEPPGISTTGAVERAMQATVGILNETPADRNTGFQGRFSVRGTGVHLLTGYILTARHAVERDQGSTKVLPQQIFILTPDMAELPARLVGGSAYLDIVLYRVGEAHRDQLPPATEFSDLEARPGDQVFTVGYPLGWGPTVAYGRIGNPHTFLPTAETRLLQADLSACSGNSGGGLFSERGDLVGVMHAIIKTEGQGDQRCSRMAFAVPAILAQRIVKALTDGQEPRFSRLGIRMAQVRVGTKWRVTVGDASGPAKDGGVQKGDLLMAIDNSDIVDAAQLKTYLMEKTTPGQTVILHVLRNGQELKLPVVLGGA